MILIADVGKYYFYKKTILMEIVFTLDEIENAANLFINLLQNYKIITFNGDLGAGKTTLIASVCKLLGVAETVTSPTYSIIQEYRTKTENIIYHLDLYRIKSVPEAIDAGVEDCLESGEICLVEWPEKASVLFSEKIVRASLETLSANKRKLVVQLP